MFNKLFLSVGFLFFTVAIASGQDKYLVGSAKVSIDPDTTVFSLPLAGYGAPREGRFSIEWKLSHDLTGVKLLTALNGKFYAVNNEGKLVVSGPLRSNPEWKSIGTASDIKTITGLNSKLYAVTANNEVLSLDTKKPKGWVKTGTADNIVALTALHGKLYASTSANSLLEGKVERSKITWKNIGEANQVVLLTNDGNKLYGVNAKNTMYSIKPGANKPWLKVGVNNSSTYTVKIKQLVVFANRLYTLGNDDKLYIAIHNTDNSLSSRALAIKNKNTTVVIVTLDLTGFDFSLGEDVKAVIAKKRKIPASAIIINASHTHFAPVSQWFPTFGEHGQIPDSAYFNNVLKKGIIRSVELALDNMSPATIAFGRGSTNIGHNRSSADGETPYDNVVDVLKFTNDKDKVSSLLFLTGCHPVFKNEGKEGVTVSANYPGVSRKLLEEKTGAKTSLFVQGCGGDINPRDDDHYKTGSDLATDVLGILSKSMTPIKGGISYTMDTIAVPTHPWSKEKIDSLKAGALKEPGNVYAEKDVRWANLMLGYYEHNTVPKIMPVYVQTITIGNWKLVGVSREVVTEYGPAIRAIWPDKLVSVAGYCNDVPSYLPMGRHIKSGTYEGIDSFFWNAQPSFFPENIFDIVISAIKKIKN